MSEENITDLVCPNCGKAVSKPTLEILDSIKMTCDRCGHEVTLDRRGQVKRKPKLKD